MRENAILRHIRFALALALSSPLSCPAAPPAAPDIVLITLDTTRADHLGYHGYFRNTSPTLDRIATESVVFERCIVPMAQTLPTHFSILTASAPREHGALTNYAVVRRDGEARPAASHVRPVAALARAAGYRTAAFISAFPLRAATGIDAGFDHFDDSLFVGTKALERRAAATNERIARWLPEAGDDPLFLWVHYFDPHAPWDPPSTGASPVFPEDGRLRQYLDRGRFRCDPRARAVQRLDVSSPAKMVDGYDGEIRYMDAQIAAFLESFEVARSGREPILIVVGDHGESLCQHGEPTHGGIWDEQLHVPLLMRIPGREPRRIATPVSATELFPLLGALADLAWLQPLSAEANVAAALVSREGTRSVLSRQPGDPKRKGDFRYTLTSERWKYVLVTNRQSQSDLLFDLRADPLELENVIADHPDVARTMAAEIRRRAKLGVARRHYR